ncbi:death domain-associated protein 6 isoform X2 [Rhinoraja longicauda]
MAAARFHDRFRPTASAEVVNLLSDEEDEEQRPEPRDIDTASASNRAPPEPRRVHLRPAAFAALLPALGEEPPEHDLDRGFVFFENQKLFCEFMEYCGTLTEENPEVMSFLQKKYDKAFPDYLASTEFRNILGRCLTRVQGKKSKVFVYINELCTALKANSQKNKLALVGRENSKLEVEGGPSVTEDSKEQGACPERTSVPTEGAPSTSVPTLADRKRSGSRRQIRYLENLLKVYADEIRRLQEREMNLEELEDEDSSYIQEHRLKKKMMKIFEKLCELKNCLNLTGRVIEQRIPFTGTRYPEINRKVERFINKPDHFPDYLDIRNIMQKVSTRHSLGLSHRQIHSMAQDVFREVGNRLQERRHLDLVYNFGSHLTDDYKPAKDPASMDNTLEKRLRQNRSVALGRLDEVVKKFAEIQDVGEMEEEEKRKKKLQQQQATALSASEAGSKGVTEQTEAQTEAQTEEEEVVVKEEEVEDAASDEEEEEEEEDLSSETDIEEELSKIEMAADPEEEPQEDETGEGSDVDEVDVLPEDSLQSSDEESEGPEEADAEAGEEGRVVPSGERPEQAGAEDSPTCTRDGGELEQQDVVDGHSAHSVGNSPAGTDRELGDRQPVRQTKRSRADSSGQKEEAVTPPSEACEDISSDEQKSVTTLTTRMCDTGTMVCSEAQPLTLKDNANLDKTPVIDKENLLQTDRQVSGLCLTAVNGKEGDSVLDGSPVAKRIKREGAVNQGNVEEIELMVIEGPDCVPCLPGDKSPLPAVDSTQADSPLVSVVTSSQTSPARHKRVNVATQCDPEEIIILSDSD